MVGWIRVLLIPVLTFGVVVHGESREIYDLHVLEDLPVYSEPSERAARISKLSRGDKVVVSQRIYKSFRKILITHQGKMASGYVPGRLIVKSQIRSRDEKPGSGRPYKSAYTFGVALVASYLRQGESSFQLSDSQVYDTSVFQSFGIFLSIFTDGPLGPKWGIRGYLSLRETDFEGTVTERNSLGPTPPTSKANRKQSLTGVGVVFKNYQKPSSNWWWGFGGEAAMGSKVTISIDGVNVPTQEDSKPFFAILFGGLGADVAIPFSRSFFLVPDVRLGTIVSTKPVTLYLESFLGLGYQF